MEEGKKLDNDEELKEISPYLKECSELALESLGAYLLNYLNELKAETKEENNKILDKDELAYLILSFQERVKSIKTNSMKSSKLRRDFEYQFNLLVRKFNDIFFPSPPPKPPLKITISNGRRTSIAGSCHGCSVPLKFGWKYKSNIGDIYFCVPCEKEIPGINNSASVDMWSKMVFSGFETNRRKH